MSRVVPASWMPDVAGQWRIVTHWSAGGYEASEVDREHYHILVEGDGKLIRGEVPISANSSTSDRNGYAAHCRGLNTRSIGVAVCCMSGAMESPFKEGRAPMTRVQWDVMALVVADLCERYAIPVAESRVLGHGEVPRVLGIPQQRWDPLTLPWNPKLGKREVGDLFRQAVRDALGKAASDALQAAPVTVLLKEALLSDEALLIDGSSYVPLRPLDETHAFRVMDIDRQEAKLQVGSGPLVKTIEATIRGGRGYGKVTDLAKALGWSTPVWDAKVRTVRIG